MNSFSRIDSMAHVARARLKLAICEAALEAMIAITVNPTESPLVTLHEEACTDAYFDLQAAEYHADAAETALAESEVDEQQQEYNRTHTWVQALLDRYRGDTPKKLADKCIALYISARHTAEFGWDCTVNPEGVRPEVLHLEEDQARNLMLASLSQLADHEIEEALAARKMREHDGSYFQVASLHDVVTWRLTKGQKTIAATSHWSS